MGRSSLKSVAKLIDMTNKSDNVEEQFLHDLKTSIEKSTDSDYIPSKTIKPSSFNCTRNAYYQLVGQVPDKDSKTYQLLNICDSGTDRHIRMQKAIAEMHKVLGVDCEYIDVADFIKLRNLEDLEVKGQFGIEYKIYNKKYNMSFMTDGIIRYHGKYYIFEFKTETSDKFYQRKEVDESHHNQAICYSLNFKIDDVLFLYECRNDCGLKAYIYHVDDAMRKNIVDKINYCKDYASKNEVPPKPIDVLKKTCNYCNYRNQCEVDTWL